MHAQVQKVLSEGVSTLMFVFFVFFLFFFFKFEETRLIQIPLLACHHRSASKTPFKWCFAGVPMMAQMAFRAGEPMMDHHRMLAW